MIPLRADVIVAILVIVLESFPVQTSKCHENASPTAVCIPIGYTLASCCLGNNTRDASMANCHAKGEVSQNCVAYCCGYIMSPTAVYVRIGDTLANCCRGNKTKDANMVNYYAKGNVSQKKKHTGNMIGIISCANFKMSRKCVTCCCVYYHR